MTTVTLALEQETLIHQLVSEGEFRSAEEAVNFVVAQTLGTAPEYSAAERAHLQEGLDQLERGEVVTQQETEAFLQNWRRNG